jgi:hypothetical protein
VPIFINLNINFFSADPWADLLWVGVRISLMRIPYAHLATPNLVQADRARRIFYAVPFHRLMGDRNARQEPLSRLNPPPSVVPNGLLTPYKISMVRVCFALRRAG